MKWREMRIISYRRHSLINNGRVHLNIKHWNANVTLMNHILDANEASRNNSIIQNRPRKTTAIHHSN